MRTFPEYRRCLSTTGSTVRTSPTIVLPYQRLSFAPNGTYTVYDDVDGAVLNGVMECLKDAYANLKVFLSQLFSNYEQRLTQSGGSSRISLEDAKLLQPSLSFQLTDARIEELLLVIKVLTTLQGRYPKVGYEYLERAIRATRDAILMHSQQAVISDGVNSDNISVTTEQKALSAAMIVEHFFIAVIQGSVML